MKKILNKQSGFTLIEIIVVLIILGVLAAIALPNLFSNVARSRGAEAIASFSSMKAPLDACCQKNSGNCLACTTTSLGQSGNFVYRLGSACDATTTTGAGGTNGWCLRAAPTSTDDTNYIHLSRVGTGVNGTMTCLGAGTYAGVC